MDEIIVGPSKHVCLGYGGRQNGFKVCPLWSNSTLPLLSRWPPPNFVASPVAPEAGL
jgi:hypothetical protein